MSSPQPVPSILKTKKASPPSNGSKATTSPAKVDDSDPSRSNGQAVVVDGDVKAIPPAKKRVSFHVTVREHSRLHPKPLESGSNALAELADGTLLIKLRNKKLYERFYYYDPELEAISWFSKKNKGNVKSISIRSVLSIRPGKVGKEFKSMDTSEFKEWCCFTVSHRDGGLDLVAADEDTRDLWIVGIRYALKKTHGRLATVRQRRRDWVEAVFTKHDLGKKGKLTLEEAQAAMRELLPDMQSFFLKRKLNYLQEKFGDDGGSGVHALVPLSDFQSEFTSLATRRELFTLFQQYSSDTEGLSVHDLKILLEAEQQALGVSAGRCKALINQYEPVPYNRETNALGLDGLTALMKGEYTLARATISRNQDMNQPLRSYFIKSSHNSYLDGNQLKSHCTPEAVKNALVQGARLIEVDIWPGAEAGSEEPMVVYHGHTKTRPCSVQSVFDVIKEHAFTASEFPLIVLVEMHLSTADAQVALAALIAQTLGDALLRPTDPLVRKHETMLPSPNQLKRRILLCSQRAPFLSIDEGVGAEVVLHDEYAFYAEIKKKNKKKTKRAMPKSSSSPVLLAPEWSTIVALNHAPLGTDFAEALAMPDPWTLLSLSESSVIRAHDEGHLDDLLQLTQQQLVRVYPGPPRVESTNFIPTAFWTVGINCCSLNFQTHDHGYQVATGRFFTNGNCGYVRKPLFLIDEESSYSPVVRHHADGARSFPSAPRHVRVTVCSAQQLRHADLSEEEEAMDDDHQVIDPYVHVQMLGVTADEASYTTRALDNCDFNAYWNEHCSFVVLCPPLAMVQLLVLDDDIVHENFLGQAVLPFSALSTGYWHVQLCDRLGVAIPGSYLFIKLEVGDFDSDAATDMAAQQQQQQHDDMDAEQPRPQEALAHQNMRRVSFNEAVKMEAAELNLAGDPKVDGLFQQCNDVVERVRAHETAISAAQAEFMTALDCETSATIPEAVGVLTERLAGHPYQVEAEGEGISLTLEEPDSASGGLGRSLESLQLLSRAYTELLSASEDLARQIATKEEELQEMERNMQGHVDLGLLSLIRNNCAIFRSLPTRLTTLLANAEDELFSLKTAFLRRHRASIVPAVDMV
ncbi:phospholipase C [Salpingoeca rosetta]|uniref:Phosphoinositide phospholipase C n=1 Tax=Salpingoeca rosetta (strain ATCC 50818 / BSB-021) TaxID=946362 RepID=F2UBB9_SALR5|nr:phospholipase C [Salpingoeca rosetta]EGD73785.1 phospholipase C [Salpingoeca rosetta]|eukprot:XP_004993348.1 phospholipase C [Salpingoeca rosetta]